ncbi:unnamed protein product [Bursaphelenchus okinawaensis]|uniref:RING-CH-type domain-containing protein n=1 Tax=Bursaphelenchus okinawaensis TaxID=465554 RepID=A0A811LUL3_9BILA|nr:unnamed protein product [Bursaphelenchus okinawaensis]CAG9128329.1 unnamed protein product [Bursaphelenchus okinawaensis]
MLATRSRDDISTRTALLSDQIPICRICLEEDGPSDMVRPCLCSGTQARVHRFCMKEWLKASGKQRCEICKSEFGVRQRRLKPVNEWNFPTPVGDMFEDQVEFVCLFVWMLFEIRILIAISNQGVGQMHRDLCDTFESSRMAYIWWLSLMFNTFYYAQSLMAVFEKWLINNTETDWYFDKMREEKKPRNKLD